MTEANSTDEQRLLADALADALAALRPILMEANALWRYDTALGCAVVLLDAEAMRVQSLVWAALEHDRWPTPEPTKANVPDPRGPRGGTLRPEERIDPPDPPEHRGPRRGHAALRIDRAALQAELGGAGTLAPLESPTERKVG